MTLGLISGALGVAAGVIHAAFHVGATILDAADQLCISLAESAMQQHSKRMGVPFSCVRVESASVKEVYNGKIYILLIRGKAHIHGVSTEQTYKVEMFHPEKGSPSLSSCECVD